MPTKFGWPIGHGEKLRKERREFAREEAGILAKSRMAETERTQIGETERERIAEAGRMARWTEAEAGTEKRHLREFAPEGLAARQLNLAIEKSTREKNKAELDRFIGGAFAKYAKRELTDTGETITTMPEWAHIVRAEAMSMEPEEGRKYIGAAIKEHEMVETERAKLAKLTKPELERMETEEAEKTRLSALTPGERETEKKTRLVKIAAEKRKAVVKSLRKEYEAENPPPSILGRLSKAWKGRKQFPVEAPLKLKGYM